MSELLVKYLNLSRDYAYQFWIAKGASEMEASMMCLKYVARCATEMGGLPEKQQRRKLYIDIAFLEVSLGIDPSSYTQVGDMD